MDGFGLIGVVFIGSQRRHGGAAQTDLGLAPNGPRSGGEKGWNGTRPTPISRVRDINNLG